MARAMGLVIAFATWWGAFAILAAWGKDLPAPLLMAVVVAGILGFAFTGALANGDEPGER
jgi:hypothetical protein